MNIRRLDEETVSLEEIDPLCRELLRHIPASADPGDSAAARERLFSSPTQGAQPETDADWKEYVVPELRQLFRTATETVKADLKHLPPDKASSKEALRIPVKHLEAWIHALNQARLALSARYDFSEGEMEEPIAVSDDARSVALFQVHFYGLLQEFFLRQIE